MVLEGDIYEQRLKGTRKSEEVAFASVEGKVDVLGPCSNDVCCLWRRMLLGDLETGMRTMMSSAYMIDWIR